jgi:hypothetical protein
MPIGLESSCLSWAKAIATLFSQALAHNDSTRACREASVAGYNKEMKERSFNNAGAVPFRTLGRS